MIPIPEPIKKRLRPIYYNGKFKGKFKMKYSKGIYYYKIPKIGIVKSKDSLVADFGKEINIYLKEYKLKRGNVVIDVGAYVGGFSIYCSKIVKEGKVIAIEPNKENFKRLIENLKLNKVKNVIALNLALHNHKGRLILSDDGAKSTIIKRDDGNSKEVFCDRLDNTLNNLKIKKVDFIKIDVVGNENKVLEGMGKTLKCNPHVVIMRYPKREAVYKT
jgi:FkbM family methyltransferase